MGTHFNLKLSGPCKLFGLIPCKGICEGSAFRRKAVLLQVQQLMQQQRTVRAVQLECKCMQHECARQAAAIQLLETAADRRRMHERRLQRDFRELATEALGLSSATCCPTAMTFCT